MKISPKYTVSNKPFLSCVRIQKSGRRIDHPSQWGFLEKKMMKTFSWIFAQLANTTDLLIWEMARIRQRLSRSDSLTLWVHHTLGWTPLFWLVCVNCSMSACSVLPMNESCRLNCHTIKSQNMRGMPYNIVIYYGLKKCTDGTRNFDWKLYWYFYIIDTETDM